MKKWYKDEDGRMISGVFSGLSIYLGIDKTIVRIMFIIIMIFTAAYTVIPYIVMSIILPVASNIILDNENTQNSNDFRRGLLNRKVAGVCSGMQNRFGIDANIIRFIFLLLMPVSILIYGILILIIPNEIL